MRIGVEPRSSANCSTVCAESETVSSSIAITQGLPTNRSARPARVPPFSRPAIG